MRVNASFRGVLLSVSAVAACSAPSNTRSAQGARGAGVSRVGAFAKQEWEGHMPDVERYVSPERPMRTLAMRSGSGLVALLQDAPSSQYLIEVDMGAYLPVMGAGAVLEQRGGNPPLGVPSDVVGVTRDGLGWFLDPTTGRVMSSDVGGNHALVATLGGPGTVRAGCALGDHAIAFLDDARPGTVFVRTLGRPADASAPTRALPVPSGYVDRWSAPWSEVRFGGSRGGPCVLWAPGMRGVLLVSDTAVRPLGPLIEPPAAEPWYKAAWRRVTRKPTVPATLDATSFPGGVALLAGGRPAGAGRMVDLYTEGGAYVETMVLPRRALRIAGNRERLYVLGQHRDSVTMGSYVLPWSVRSAMRREAAAELYVPVLRPPPDLVILDTVRPSTPGPAQRSRTGAER